jgi:flavin reductase (DIM6/NTAB) family NADH-FMN oxidoreductase RutF
MNDGSRTEQDSTGRLRAEPEGDLSADERGGRWLRRRFAGTVTVVTTRTADGTLRGATVSAAIMASVRPVLILVSLERESQMEEWVMGTGLFGISLLSWRQQLLADRFAGFAPLVHTTFRDVPHSLGQSGVPLLDGSIGWAECRVLTHIESGDHTCLLGEATNLGRGSGANEDPLLYYLNRYRRLRE